jgi:hypothetical protein
MEQTLIRSRRNVIPSTTTIVIVMPGRLCWQVANRAFGNASHCLLDDLTHRLNQFRGAHCTLVVDTDILRVGLYPKLTDALRNLMGRTKSRAVFYADYFDERDRSRSALAVAQHLIGRIALDAAADTIWLTGAGWDETDQPTDLLGYAFRGLGFSTILDTKLRLLRQAA